MQSSWKIGILLLLLAIPIFLVLFFQFFTTSHYEIPVYYQQGIDSLSQCKPTQEVHRLAALQASNALTEENQYVDFRGRLQVMYWVPGECTDTCLLVLEKLARLQGVIEASDSLQIIFVSNSSSLSVEELAAYDYNGGTEWLFLRGTESQQASFLQCELILPQAAIPLNETLVLIDEEGRIRGYYQGTSSEEVDRLIGEIRILLYNRNMMKAHANDAG